MNNNIEFYIPEDETIPTQLRLTKGKVKIYYEEKKINSHMSLYFTK